MGLTPGKDALTAPQRPLKGRAACQYIQNRLGFPFEALNRFPKWLLIETVNRCNARCLVCGIDFKAKKKVVMADDLFEKIAAEVGRFKDHVEKVMLYLEGEPLLDPGLAGRVRRMKAAGVKRVNIATNGSLLGEARARELLEAGLDEVYITIDSLDKDRFEAIRPGLRFEKVRDNTLGLIRLREELKPEFLIRVQMIIQELNLGEEEAFVDYWSQRLGPGDQVVIQRAHNWASAAQVMKFGDEDQVNDYPCIAIWGTLACHADGEIGLCCVDSRRQISLGNLNRSSIEELWKGQVIRWVRSEHLRGRRSEIPLCDGCTLWREDKREIKS